MNSNTKIYPEELKYEVKKALSFYPNLEDTPIEFKFKPNIKRSTMQAQPRFSKVLLPGFKREYIIFIKTDFELGAIHSPIEELPNKVLIGWLGHELGHIMDYEQMNNFKLITFGVSYLTSQKAIVNAERRADEFAIRQGMRDYILETKNFILNHADIPQKYKNRIKKYYLSPEEIMEMVTE